MSAARWLAVGVFLLALAFYGYTLAPSVAWGDGARLQMDVLLGGSTYMFFDEMAHVPTDGLPFDRLGVIAWDHPLYVMAGHLLTRLPLGDPPFRVNLLSAVAAALALALFSCISLALTGQMTAAALGAAALAVSHTFWFHAVTAEVYASHCLAMAGLIWLTLRWRRLRRPHDLALWGLVAGLGLANHIMFILTLAPAGVFLLQGSANKNAPLVVTTLLASSGQDEAVVRGGGRLKSSLRKGLWAVAAAAFLFALGLAPWWIQFIRMARLIGAPLTFELAAGIPWLFGSPSLPLLRQLPSNLAQYAAALLYQFTPVGVVLGVYGALQLRRRAAATAYFLLALYGVHILF